MRLLQIAFRVMLVAGCAFAFACALLIVWACSVAGTPPEEWWFAWVRLMVTGKSLAALGLFGDARVKAWQRELSSRAATPVAPASAGMPWELDAVSR